MFNTGMKKTPLQLRPYRRNAGEQTFDSLGALVCIKSDTEQTGGVFNLFDVLLPAGYETPLRIHYAEDVALQVLEVRLMCFGAQKGKMQRLALSSSNRAVSRMASVSRELFLHESRI
jgi:hypothetical protein